MTSFSESKLKKNFPNEQKIVDTDYLNSPDFHRNKEANKTNHSSFNTNQNERKSKSNKGKNSQIDILNSFFLQNDTELGVNNNTNKREKYNKALNIECNKTNCLYPNYCSSENKICVCGLAYAEYDLYQKDQATNQINNSSSDLNSTSNDNNSNSNFNSSNMEKQKVIYCGYERKKQTVYFLLEFFSNIGVGHFYAKNYLIAGVKFGLIFFPWTLIIVAILMSIAGSDFYKDIKGVTTCWALLFICFSGVLWIVDSILIGKGLYSDGNGVPLLSW